MQSRTSLMTATSADSATGRPSITNRSVRSSKWGDVNRAARCPAARNAASTIAVTDPLPLVPAMWTESKGAIGPSEGVDDRADVVETELDPEPFQRVEIVERGRTPAHGTRGAPSSRSVAGAVTSSAQNAGAGGGWSA